MTDSRRRGRRKERERKGSTWTQEVWRSPFTCQVIRWWCVFTPWRCRNQTHPAPFKSPLPTISSCSHVGQELETRQKSSVSAANVLQNRHTLQSKLQHQKEFHLMNSLFFFFFNLWPFRRLGQSQCRVKLIRSIHTFK